MTTPKLNYIGLVAADLRASLAFYRNLGFDIPEPEADQVHVQIQLPNGMWLAWDTVDVAVSMGGWQTPTGSPRMSLAMECASPEEVDTVFQSMVTAGYPGEHPPFDAPWGQRYATILDPDGNGIDLYAVLPA